MPAATPASIPSGAVGFVVETGAQWRAPLHPDASAAAQLATMLRNATPLADLPHGPPPQPGVNILVGPPTSEHGWEIGFTDTWPPVTVAPDVVRCAPGANGLQCSPVDDDALIDGRAVAAPGLVALLTSLTAGSPQVPPLTVQPGPGALLSIRGQGWVGPSVTLTLSWCVPHQPCRGGGRPLGSAAVHADGTFSGTALLPPDLPADATAFSVNASDGVRTSNANIDVPPASLDHTPDPASPVRFVVDTRMATPAAWSAPLRATTATAPAMDRLATLLRAAQPGPPIAAGPYPQIGLNRAQTTALERQTFIVGLATAPAPLTIDPQVVYCTAAPSGPACNPTADYVLIDGHPEKAPGLAALLTGMTDTLPGVPPLQPHVQGNTLTVSGQGWVGARVTLLLRWCDANSCGGPSGTPLATVPVNADGTFSWTGPLPSPPSGSPSGNFTLNAADGVRTAESMPSSLF